MRGGEAATRNGLLDVRAILAGLGLEPQIIGTAALVTKLATGRRASAALDDTIVARRLWQIARTTCGFATSSRATAGRAATVAIWCTAAGAPRIRASAPSVHAGTACVDATATRWITARSAAARAETRCCRAIRPAESGRASRCWSRPSIRTLREIVVGQRAPWQQYGKGQSCQRWPTELDELRVLGQRGVIPRYDCRALTAKSGLVGIQRPRAKKNTLDATTQGPASKEKMAVACPR